MIGIFNLRNNYEMNFLGLLDFYILFCNVDGIIGDNKSYLGDIKAIIVDVGMGIYGGMSEKEELDG